MRERVRLMTWNVQGLHGVDVPAVDDLLTPLRLDALALQEVQPRQCRQVADALGMQARWAFKHWPIPHRREGLAVLSPHRIVATDAFVLRRAMPWNWRRRVALAATIELGASTVEVVAVHLSPHDHARAREREIDRVLARVGERSAVVVGDFNDHPDGPMSVTLHDRGWRDAWREARGDEPGATNWTAGARSGRPPTQRLDYVFVPDGCRIDSARVLDDPLDRLAGLSDHLPLLVELTMET